MAGFPFKRDCKITCQRSGSRAAFCPAKNEHLSGCFLLPFTLQATGGSANYGIHQDTVGNRIGEQFARADNMTDRQAALQLLVDLPGQAREAPLARFYETWQKDPLVLDKWFTVQALSTRADTFDRVAALARHPDFTLANPNRVRALVGAFAMSNPVRFHAADGAGYAFVAEQIIALDALNPQVAARLARAFDRWRKFDAKRQAHARQALERIRDSGGLSKDTLEVVTKSLA